MKKLLALISCILFFQFNSIAQTQMEMNKDASDYYQTADKKMTKIYREVMGILKPVDKKLLLEAQRNWVKFKESHCKSVKNGFQEGSIESLIYYTCLLEATEERIKQLQKYKVD